MSLILSIFISKVWTLAERNDDGLFFFPNDLNDSTAEALFQNTQRPDLAFVRVNVKRTVNPYQRVLRSKKARALCVQSGIDGCKNLNIILPDLTCEGIFLFLSGELRCKYRSSQPLFTKFDQE